MKKRNSCYVILSLIFVLTMMSCANDQKFTVVYVDNYSDFDVTEILLNNDEDVSQEILKPNESCVLIYRWYFGDGGILDISFYMKGEQYGCRPNDEVIADGTKYYKPFKLVEHGDIVTVRIYNDHWQM